MAMFSRYGVPDTLVTDNGPCFASSEFKKFALVRGDFEYVTSSPRYPQSNGKAENAVRTIERLFTKCRATGISEFQGLLDWRNTPSEGMDTSPAQRLMGRRCKTLLPTPETLLKPRFSPLNDANKLRIQKERQRKYYNRGKRALPPIKPGETVHIRVPGSTMWQPPKMSELAKQLFVAIEKTSGVQARLHRWICLWPRYLHSLRKKLRLRPSRRLQSQNPQRHNPHCRQAHLRHMLRSQSTYHKCRHPQSGDLRDSASLLRI